jgi:hypothetical protein
LTFNTLLGFFNPIQLWVQAQGAAVALSMNLTNPARLQKVFRQMNALVIMQHEKGVLNSSLRGKIAKIGGFKDEAELLEAKRLWDKSGMYQSVLSSADVEAAARGFPTTGGALKSFADSGLMFFRTGELFNRRTSFLTALDEAGGVFAAAKSDALFKQVLDRSNDLILNLGKANRAQWQKGLLSIPTQFMQIQAKTIESVLGLNGAFTKWEARRLLIGQLGLYGSAGVFGGNWVMRNILSASGVDQVELENANPGLVRATSGGLTDWVAYQLGADITAADRGALLNGMDQTFISFVTEEDSLFNIALGPSSVLPTRFGRAVKQMSPWLVSSQDINGESQITDQDVTDALRRAKRDISALATSPLATASQYSKFRYMSDLGVLPDKNGNLIAAPKGGFNPQTEWAALIGFKPNILQAKFDLSEINQNETDYVNFRVGMLMQGFDRFLMAHQRSIDDGKPLTDEELGEFQRDHEVLMGAMDPHVRQKVLQIFGRRLSGRAFKENQYDRQMRRFWDNMIIRLTDSLIADGDLTADGTRIIQTLPPEETE